MSSNYLNSFIPVIDLFAGPGGLGEGFSAFNDSDNRQPFKISLSIEKEANAHATLELRAFFREFPKSDIPEEYYSYLRGEITKENLFSRYSKQAEKARSCACEIELGGVNSSREEVDNLIKNAIDNNPIWILIGGPPCQAYSIAGRSRMKNHVANFEADKRHTLYREYLRIMAINKPPIFIMENVKGILSSKVEGENTFKKILRDLKCPWAAIAGIDEIPMDNSYLNYNIYSLVKIPDDNKPLNPKDYVIKSEKYGVPQKRHRVILLGIRSDIPVQPTILSESEKVFTIEKAIGDLPCLRSGVSKEENSSNRWKSILYDISASTWINDPSITSELRCSILKTIPNIQSELGLGARFIPFSDKFVFDEKQKIDLKLNGVCNHAARKHMRTDLHRYFFASCFSNLYKRSPKLDEFPVALLPNHENVNNSSAKNKMFSDRFRVQIKGEPSTTIMSHISKDGHYYIHPDPTQCRSLTVREAARLQTFPDDYFFEGNQTSQYQQVGNAVPPLLAEQIARIVWKCFKDIY